jgi:hypothetical protein
VETMARDVKIPILSCCLPAFKAIQVVSVSCDACCYLASSLLDLPAMLGDDERLRAS